MIDFLDVYKGYGGDPIFDHASCRINAGDRIGIVGPNGAGKSTFFSLLTGEILPDKGSINLPKNLRIGYLRQQLPASGKLDLKLIDYTTDAIEELEAMTRELHDLEHLLAEGVAPEERDRLLARHGHLQSAAEQLGAYRLRPAAEAALCSLGFAPDSLEKPLGEFSGGWQMRASLARVLIAQPDLLMLDEPSNYLDIPAVEYLCRVLNSFKGTLLLISHDRFLLRKLTRITLEVNNGQITRYPGDYDYYRQEREQRRRTLEAAKRNTDRKKEHLEKVIDRFRAKSSKAAAAKSWQKALDKIEDVTLPDELGFSGAIRFPKPPPCGSPAAEIEGVSFGYPGAQQGLFRDLSLHIDTGDKIAFVGYNGTGKTTLLKLLVGRLKPDAGKISFGHHVAIGYQAQEFSELLEDGQSVYDTVRAALPPGASQSDLMRVLGSFGFSGDDTAKLCKVLSGGEKIRLCFARIFVNPPNLLILDEPTTHLDVSARELLQKAIQEYPGTVCFVSHDIEFVRNTATVIVAMEQGKVRKYFGNYDYYLEKSAAMNPAAAPVKTSAPSADSAKERRRERARQRSGISAEKRSAEKEVARLEELLMKQEERRDELIAELSNPDGADFAAAGKELSDLQKAIEETMKAWEDAAWKLDAIMKINAEIHEEK